MLSDQSPQRTNSFTPANGSSGGRGSAQTRSRLAALDGLRLVAALLVVMFHYVGTEFTNIWGAKNHEIFPWLYPVSTYGYLGVQFFFIISGFVICMSSWDRKLGDFFVSRTVRLYPVYWFAVLFTALVVTVMHPIASQISAIKPPHSLSDVLSNLTMLQEAAGIPHVDSVYWTLWVELRFYLLFAIVVWRGLTYRRVVLFCALWGVASLVASSSNISVLNNVVMPVYSWYFIAGIALYLIHRFGQTPLLWGIVGLCWLQAQRDAYGATTYMNGMLKTSMEWRYSALLITAFFVAIAAVALGWLSWARWRWLTVAGVLTYPVYLMHQNIGLTIIRGLHGSVPKWPLLVGTVTAMLLLAWLAHRLIERPLAPRMKRMLVRGIEQVGTATPRITVARSDGPSGSNGASVGSGDMPNGATSLSLGQPTGGHGGARTGL
ncbi:acyltransferase family protein [Planosporangium sp. 12N6]|uniref:acyltransferase family protein n=1 Tax=Planosporangium spinosum TaxID=3402278 RepID=UPI003CF02BDE